MKNLFFVSFIFIFINSNGQGSDLAPFKTNKIIISNSLTADENFMTIGRALISQGYGIYSKDKDFMVMESDFIKLNGASYVYLKFIIKDSTIELTGKLVMSMYSAPSSHSVSGELVTNKGMRKSPLLLSFEKMLDFALLLPRKSMKYEGE